MTNPSRIELYRFDGILESCSYRLDGSVWKRTGDKSWRLWKNITDIEKHVAEQKKRHRQMDNDWPLSAQLRNMFHLLVPPIHRDIAYTALTHADDADSLYYQLTDGFPCIDITLEQCEMLFNAAVLANAEQNNGIIRLSI